MRLSVAMAVGCLSVAGLAMADPSLAMMRKPTHIEAQELAPALQLFAKQRGVQVVYRSELVSNRQTAGATGELTVDEALAKLLSGTGLTFQHLSDAGITIVPVVGIEPKVGLEGNRPATVGSAPLSSGEVTLAQSETGEGSSDNGGGEKQEQSGKLEEVVVTAQKRRERLIDVPMSVTAKSGEELEARGVTNIQDLSYVVPSLSVYSTSPAQQLIVVRGISSTRGTSPLTGLYLDEMPLSGGQDGVFPAYADLRVLDLNRVEVLKGPQGTLYGEGAAGGLVRFISNDPDLNRVGGDVSTEFYDTAKGGWSGDATGVVNLPLVSGVFGIRVAAKYENVAGWIDQPSVGRKDINDSEVKHVRIKALYAPTENLRIKGMAEIHRNDYGATNTVNQLPVKDSDFLQAFDPSWPTNGQDNYDMFNLSATYDFPIGELLSSTSYAKMDSTQNLAQVVYGQPAQSTPWLEILDRNFGHDASIASQELRLTSAGNGPFHWTVGGNYKRQDLTTDFGDGIGLSLAEGIVRLPALNAGGAGAHRGESWAGFADGAYQFASHIEVGAGARYSSNSIETWDPIASPRVVRSLKSAKPTYRGYIKYALSNDSNIYFNAGTGFRTGDLNGAFQVSLGAPAEILPETTVSYELGLKAALLDRRLHLASAVFHTRYQDMFADRNELVGSNIVGYVANGQDAEVKGAEVEIDWAATDRLSLMLAGDVTDTKITKVDTSDPNRSYNVGDWINFVPRYSASAGANYRFRWASSVPGSAQLSFNRKGHQRETQRGNGLIVVKQVESPEVTFLNASVGAEWNGWAWSLFGRNLLNEDNWVNPSAFALTAQARPRTFGIGVTKSF